MHRIAMVAVLDHLATPSILQSRRSVLVVEDDLAACRALGRLLEHYEFDALLARTLADALKSLERNPDVVLLDLELPDGDGINVLRQIRHQGRSTCVAVMTGTQDDARIRLCQTLRPNLLLRKPVDLLRLFTLLRNPTLDLAPG